MCNPVATFLCLVLDLSNVGGAARNPKQACHSALPIDKKTHMGTSVRNCLPRSPPGTVRHFREPRSKGAALIRSHPCQCLPVPVPIGRQGAILEGGTAARLDASTTWTTAYGILLNPLTLFFACCWPSSFTPSPHPSLAPSPSA